MKRCTRLLRLFLVLVLVAGPLVGGIGEAFAATASTGPAGTSYYQYWTTTGGWSGLQTPPHTVDGAPGYCLEQNKDFPVNNASYTPFSPETMYNFNTYVGLQSILHRGYPYVTPSGMTADQARYATANAIRAWMRESAGVGYVFMDLSLGRVRPADSAIAARMFNWTVDLVQGARNRVIPASTVSANAITLRPNADYTRLVGQTTVAFNDLNGYYTVVAPPGVTVSGHTGHAGDVLTVSVPCTAAWIGRSVMLTLYGYDSRVPANIFYYAPGASNYQRVVTANPHSFQIAGSNPVPVGSGSGALSITKTDVVDSAPLDGAVFELLWNSTVVASGTTASDGDLTFTGLAPGTWTVRERTAPQGYLVDVTEHSVTVLDGRTALLGVTNERALRPVRVTKTGEAGEVLAGAVYQIRETAGSVVATLTTGSDGSAESEPLAFGNYELIETTPPLGHVIDETPYPFTIGRTTPVVLEIQRTDERVRGTVRIEKRSGGQDARLLEGAGYELYHVPDTSELAASFDPAEASAEPVATLTTDSNGVARSGLLEYGCYYAVETTAPVGHALDTTEHHFEIREHEAVIQLDLTDEVLPVDHGGVMLRYRNVWDSTEIAPAWGYNAAIGTEYMPRVRAEGLDKMPIEGFSYLTADYASQPVLVDGKLLVTYWYRQTVSGDWLRVRTGDDGRAELRPKDRETYGLLSTAELYERLVAAQKVNGDVIGYLSIPGTDLHEPVVQTTDNTRYLSQGLDGRDDARGALFADYRSPRYVGDSSRTTLLHGHNMRDGSMFGILSSYGDATFWAEHPFIQYVDAAGNGGTWLVYSAHMSDGGDDAFAFPAMRPYYERIARWADRSFLDPGFRPDPAGRTLTLSTCAYHARDGKLLVHAELID